MNPPGGLRRRGRRHHPSLSGGTCKCYQADQSDQGIDEADEEAPGDQNARCGQDLVPLFRGKHWKRRRNLDLGLDGYTVGLGIRILRAEAQVAQADDAHVCHYHSAWSRVAPSWENM